MAVPRCPKCGRVLLINGTCENGCDKPPVLRLRVNAQYTDLNGWCWWYQIQHTGMPEGNQWVITGGSWPKQSQAFIAGIIQLQACIDRNKRRPYLLHDVLG